MPLLKYKWHHFVVSLLCVLALAAVVSSLFSTINNIHNVKKKRDLSRRAIEETDTGNDTNAAGGNELSSMMEINHSIATTPQQPSIASVSNSSNDVETDDEVEKLEEKSTNNNTLITPVNKTITKNDEHTDELESDFESAESNDDESGEGSGNDQVDSVEGSSTTNATARTSTNTVNTTNFTPENSTLSEGSAEGDDDNDNEEEEEDDEVDDKTDVKSSKNATVVAQSQQNRNKQKVWHLASISSSLSNKMITIGQSPQTNLQSNKTIPTASLKNDTSNQTATVQPVNAKAPAYAIATYGVINHPAQIKPSPKNQSINSQQQSKVFKKPQVTKINGTTKSNAKTQITPSETQHFVSNMVSNATVKNISSSLYQSDKVEQKGLPYLRNINEEHKDGSGNSSTSTNYPTFPKNYHASGIIILPNSKIAEPFEIWYAPDFQRSRIDYYYGNDKTFQLGDRGSYGVSYKYVPMFNDKEKNFDGCYTLTGTQNRRIIAQVITPNMTWFKYNKTEVYTGVLTTKWTYQYSAYGMKNYQSVWITKTKPYRPIRYEMFGFDMMLGSYYDNYVINYVSFEEWTPDSVTFDLPPNIHCFNWTNSLEASLAVNPMQEFTAFSPESAVDHHARYAEFKNKHYKDKPHPKDSDKRKHVYKHNARFINSHNRKNLSYKLKANMFTDKFDEELDHFHGSLEKDTKKHEGIKEFHKLGAETSSHPVDKDIPEEIDWRNYGAVSAVGGQGICGACYAFSAAEAVEGAWYRKTSKMVHLSKQQLVDCSWGFGNHGCKGGHYAGALSWVFVHGISTSKSYGKYLGQEGYCHFNDTWFGANIEGFAYVPVWNSTALKKTIAMHGPVAISINTIPLSFKFYSKGIYDDPKCEKNRTTHSALVVGYGKENGREFWIVKNSWSSLWGEKGYIRVAMKDDLCGITEYPVAVIVKHPSFQLPKNVEPADEEPSETIDGKDADQLPKEDGTNIPANPSGTKKEPKELPGNIDEENTIKDPKTNEDEQDDEDEQVEKQNKQIISHLHHQQQKLQQKQQQMILKHQENEGIFEKSLSSMSVPVKGLHIEDINNDIKKIHMMLVNTAAADHGKENNQHEQNGEAIKAFGKPKDGIFESEIQHGIADKNSLSTNKAKVASPVRPVDTTTYHVKGEKIKMQEKKTKKKQKSKKKNSKGKSNKKQKQKPTKRPSHKDMKKELKALINKLDYAELTAMGKDNVNKAKNVAKKGDIQTAKKPQALNPENIGSLNAKRSKTSTTKGTRKSSISRVEHSNKQKLHQQRELSRKKKSKVEDKYKRSKPNPSIHTNSQNRFSLYEASPIRRSMDLHFFGMPSDSVNEAIAMESKNLKRGKITKHQKNNKAESRSHKKSKIASKKSDTAIEVAKESSLDNLYSLIDQKVHDYTSHSNKKRDMNYYKHHIKNG